MDALQLLALIAVMLPLAAMPSASVVLVVAKSISAGRMSGAFAAAGIVAGDLVFVGIALSGMTMLAEHLGALFTAVKLSGGAYLVYLGLRLIWVRPMPAGMARQAAEAAEAAPVSDFMAGLLLTLGDVKAIFFYASLFPAVVDLEQAGWRELWLIVAVTVAVVGGVKLGYVLLASRISERVCGRVPSVVLQRIGGAALIGCAAVLITRA